MNDPGLDEPISNDVKDVETQQRDEREAKEEDEQEFLEPSRWWFASTAFPLIAGTFGPMASAFSICALVVRWREYIPPGSTEGSGVSVDDPQWLIAINAAQLGIALISNLSLLMNMARRVRFSIAQPVTIIGWYISSFALLGLCICARGPLIIEPREDHAFTQAFYYAIFAAFLYLLVASLMLVTVIGAYKGHYPKEFQLTMSQRTLMLQTISFLCYLLLGALIFSHVEEWEYLDAVYWADFTLLTIGIGDYAPVTHLGRSLLIPFAIGGIIILGLVIGSIRSLVLERGKVKMGARMVEKERRRLLKKMETSDKSGMLEPIASNPNSRPSTRSSTATTKTPSGYKRPQTERERREMEFKLMRKIQEDAHRKRRWTSLIISGFTWFVLWFLGAAVFRATEHQQGWSYFVSLYFAYTSLLTIGYGDYSPSSNAGKPFFVFWSLMAIPSLTILISNMGDTIVKGIRDATLWIGNFTVLPGEQGVKATLRESAKKVSRRRMFNSKVEEIPPGLLGETNNDGGGDSEDDEAPRGNERERRNDPESAAQKLQGNRAKREGEVAKKKAKKNDKLPESKRHYHALLIKEAREVMKHIHSSPPRKYTFDEWAWYLKLIGEDEDEAETHRKAARKPKSDGKLKGLGEASEEKRRQWSWVDNRSPLMGNKGEAEWVLERLTKTLERELEAMRREEMEMEKKGESEETLRENSSKEGLDEERGDEIQPAPLPQRETPRTNQ